MEIPLTDPQWDDLFTFTHLVLKLGLKPVFPEKLPVSTSAGFCLPGIASSFLPPLSSFFIPTMEFQWVPTHIAPFPGLQGHKLGPSIYFSQKFKQKPPEVLWKCPESRSRVSCCWWPGAYQSAVLPKVMISSSSLNFGTAQESSFQRTSSFPY